MKNGFFFGFEIGIFFTFKQNFNPKLKCAGQFEFFNAIRRMRQIIFHSKLFQSSGAF